MSDCIACSAGVTLWDFKAAYFAGSWAQQAVSSQCCSTRPATLEPAVELSLHLRESRLPSSMSSISAAQAETYDTMTLAAEAQLMPQAVEAAQ